VLCICWVLVACAACVGVCFVCIQCMRSIVMYVRAVVKCGWMLCGYACVCCKCVRVCIYMDVCCMCVCVRCPSSCSWLPRFVLHAIMYSYWLVCVCGGDCMHVMVMCAACFNGQCMCCCAMRMDAVWISMCVYVRMLYVCVTAHAVFRCMCVCMSGAPSPAGYPAPGYPGVCCCM